MPKKLPLVLSILPALAAAPAGETRPATSPATRPVTTTKAAPKLVEWHVEYAPAAAQARKDGKLLLVIYNDPAAPAGQTLEEVVLADHATREFLAAFSAVRLNATAGDGKKRFAKTGAKEAPLTQVLSPTGELLDFVGGCILPPSAFCERLRKSLAYWRAATAKPLNRLRAAEARLALATRDKAGAEIDVLLKAQKLSRGERARLHLVKALALVRARPKQADQQFRKAIDVGAGDHCLAGRAMLELAELKFSTGSGKADYQAARDLCARYVKQFPRGQDIGRARYDKALIEFLGLKDAAAARKTLKELLEKHPDDPRVVPARALLDRIGPARKPAKTTRPATTTRPAKPEKGKGK